MFTDPKRGNGLNESPICYATKKLWAIVCYYEIYKEITFKYFIENIEYFIKKYQFDWPTGKPYPKYSTACKWPSKYDYDECVQCFENKQLKFNTEKAANIHDKKHLPDTIDDYQNYDAYNREIRKELEKDNPDPNEIEKWEKLKELSWNRNRKRSGKDVQKVDVNADVHNTNENTLDIDNDLLEGLYAIYNRRDKEFSNESS